MVATTTMTENMTTTVTKNMTTNMNKNMAATITTTITKNIAINMAKFFIACSKIKKRQQKFNLHSFFKKYMFFSLLRLLGL